MDDYNEAIRLDPSLVMAYNGRGHLFERLGEDAKALADFEKALDLTNVDSHSSTSPLNEIAEPNSFD
ncbi:tetratricopeptide repeat domain protein [Rhodopirellula sallentina SM41]|uniref:Tetratricopeptide repeat domain protein n=1 Tax=Rhodopirellula sallentina SM41 TaxID=1263870 RepID=M5UGG5_9BACT|nr:tetratricopeptide repeat domain protein [Rhodopirellula sallentina SM41]